MDRSTNAVLLNDRGEASGLKVIWKLDEFYAAYVIEDIARDGTGRERKPWRTSRAKLRKIWRSSITSSGSAHEPQTFKVTKPGLGR